MSIRSTFRKTAKPQTVPRPPSRSGQNIPAKIFVWGVLLFGLYVGVGYLLSLPAFRIEAITISGNNVLVLADVEPVVRQEIQGFAFWPYRKDSIFVVPRKKIREELLLRFGRLEKVSFDKKGLKELGVVVHERDGQYMWCGAVEELGASDDCYVLDARGSLFDKAPEVSGDAYFKIYGGEVDSENPLGSQVFSLDEFNTIMRIKNELDKHRLEPIALLRYNDGLIEFVKKTEGKSLYEGGRIKFTLLADYKTSIDNLLSALASEPLASEFAEKEDRLEYIDVRFSNRVYYKFR